MASEINLRNVTENLSLNAIPVEGSLKADFFEADDRLIYSEASQAGQQIGLVSPADIGGGGLGGLGLPGTGPSIGPQALPQSFGAMPFAGNDSAYANSEQGAFADNTGNLGGFAAVNAAVPALATASVEALANVAPAAGGILVNEQASNGGSNDVSFANNSRDGRDGRDGQDGADGNDGQDGHDGHDGHDGDNGMDGEDGEDGEDGCDGHNGHGGGHGCDGHDGHHGHGGDCHGGDHGHHGHGGGHGGGCAPCTSGLDLGAILQPILVGTIAVIDNTLTNISGNVTQIVNNVSHTLDHALESVDHLVDTANNLVEQTLSTTENVLANVTTTFNGIANQAVGTVNNVLGQVVGSVDNLVNQTLQSTDLVLNQVNGVVDGVVTIVGDTTGDLVGQVNATLNNITSGLSSTVSGTLDSVIDNVGGIFQGGSCDIDQPIQQIIGTVENILADPSNATGGIVNGVLSNVGGITGGLLDTVGGSVIAPIDGLSGGVISGAIDQLGLQPLLDSLHGGLSNPQIVLDQTLTDPQGTIGSVIDQTLHATGGVLGGTLDLVDSNVIAPVDNLSGGIVSGALDQLALQPVIDSLHGGLSNPQIVLDQTLNDPQGTINSVIDQTANAIEGAASGLGLGPAISGGNLLELAVDIQGNGDSMQLPILGSSDAHVGLDVITGAIDSQPSFIDLDVNVNDLSLHNLPSATADLSIAGQSVTALGIDLHSGVADAGQLVMQAADWFTDSDLSAGAGAVAQQTGSWLEAIQQPVAGVADSIVTAVTGGHDNAPAATVHAVIAPVHEVLHPHIIGL